MVVYIAGASSELDLVSHYRDRLLQETDHKISHDWVRVITDRGLPANPRGMPLEEVQRIAREDLVEGIDGVDAVWLIVPEKHCFGCWVELGYAIARARNAEGPKLIVSGDYEKSIFLSLADHRFALHTDALSWFKQKR